MKLLELFKQVKDEKLSKEQIEDYHKQLCELRADIKLELATIQIEAKIEEKIRQRTYIKSFIKDTLLLQRQEIIEKVEEIKKNQCICHSGGGYAVCCEECKHSLNCGYNQALEDVLKELK